MAYMDALKAIQKRQNEFDDYTDAMRNTKFMSRLNFNPKTMLGLGLAGSGTRMMAAAGQGDIGVNDPSFLSEMAPYAGSAMMGVLPLRMLSQAYQRKKRETELGAQKELSKRSPGSIGVGDVTKSLGIAADNISNTSMNTYMTMMAMGTLGGALGIDGSSELSKAALVPYGISGATGGPLRALSAYMGFGGLEHAISGNSSLAAAAANDHINPITGGLTSLPWLVG
jgi:putative Mn2+ efflux pump MntP